MVKVTANGKTIAESNNVIVVENSYYFPPDSVDKSLLTNSKTRYDPSPARSGAHLTFSPFGYTAPSVRGKGLPASISPPSSKLTGDLTFRTAAYYDATIDGKPIQDIAWYYPNPNEKAHHIKNYVAFYKVTLAPQPTDCTR